MHKLSPAATKNADCYRTMTRPVNNMTMRSDYNSKQQSNIPPNLGGSAISEIKEGEAYYLVTVVDSCCITRSHVFLLFFTNILFSFFSAELRQKAFPCAWPRPKTTPPRSTKITTPRCPRLLASEEVVSIFGKGLMLSAATYIIIAHVQ